MAETSWMYWMLDSARYWIRRSMRQHLASRIQYPASSATKLLLLLFCNLASASTTDWPLYRHDAALSGVSPGKGSITDPEVKWEYYLGAPFVSIATAGSAPAQNVVDLDGDGTL